jgi:hypothetical protein
MKIEGAETGISPIQFIICLKERKNQKKAIPIDGSLTLSVPFSNQTFVFSWIRVS